MDGLPASLAAAEARAGTAAVIIPHYNDTARLTRCLDRLVPQLAAHPGVEVVVCDNGSTEDMTAVRAAFPEVRFVAETEKGAGPARNRGVAETDAAHLFFIDADCVPAPGWLDRAVALAGTADIIGGRVDTFDETPAPKSPAEAYETVWAFHQKHYVENRGFSVTANLLTRRAIFLDVGPFMNGLPEDIEWCRRARGKGYRLVYADDLAVSHPTRADWPSLRRKFLRLTMERQRMFGTAPARRLAWALRAILVPGYALVQLPEAFRHPGLTPAERRRALAMLARVTGQRMAWMLAQSLGRPIS